MPRRTGDSAGAGRHQQRDNYQPPVEPRFPLPPPAAPIPPLITTVGQAKPDDAWFDDEASAHALGFFDRLYHFEGRFAGNAFRLEQWQRDIVSELFGWKRGDGTRLYRVLYLEVPRKNGKSTFAAGLALYLAYEDGEPAPQVFFAAADKDQARIAYHMAEVLVRQDRDMAAASVIYNSTNKMLIPETNGELRALSSETKKLFGLNLHGLIFDELMAQQDRRLWDALTTSQGARAQPLIIAITTAGWDRQSIAYEQREYARQIMDGALSDPTFLGVCYSADEGEDWTAVETWRSAAPNLGVTVSLEYYERKAKEAQGQPSAQNAFRTLMLCQWVGQASRIIPMAEWNACTGLKVPKLKGRPCFAGLDLSQTTDMTALVLDFPIEGGKHAWEATLWVPETGLRDRGLRDRAPYEVWAEQGWLKTTPGTVVDYAYVKAALREAAEKYELKDVSYDRWGATGLAEELENDGFTMMKVGQGFASMSAPTKELIRLVVSGSLLVGENPVLTWMADNAGGETDAAENLKLSKVRSSTRIDGLVAGVMALDGAMRRGIVRRSVYEDYAEDDELWYEKTGEE